MSIKEQIEDQSNQKQNASQKSEKTIFKEIENMNLNTSLESSKNQDQVLKEDQRHEQKPQLFKKEEIQKEKAEVQKALEWTEKQQTLIKTLTQKLSKKLPKKIDNSPHNKQNFNTNLGKKSSALNLNRPWNENDDSSVIQRSKKPHVTEINYSVVNGKKVYMSEEDLEKLKKLKIQYKKREQQIKKRIALYDRQVQKVKTDEFMSKEKNLKAEKEKRMRSIQQKEKILQKEREHKLQRFKQENKKLNELKKSKKLFQKMEEQYHVLEQQKKIHINQMIKSTVESVRISFVQIKKHEKEYLGKKQQTIENSRVKIHSKLKKLEELSHLNLHKSKFYEKAKCEKKQLQLEIQENQRKRKAYSEKIQQYKQIVKENYMPTVIKVQKEEENKLPTYNAGEIQNIGNSYMKQGTKLIDRNKSLNLLQKMKKEEIEKKSRKIYKNYLRENKPQNASMEKSRSYSQLLETQIDKQLKTINSTKNPQEKYEKIKILQGKIQRDIKPTLPTGGKIKIMTRNKYIDAESLVQINQIAAKIKLLQGINEAPCHQGKIKTQI